VPDDIEAGSTEKLVDLIFNSQSVYSRPSAVSSHLPDNQGVDLEIFQCSRG